MKAKIKVKLINPDCNIEVIQKGDWIDLRAGETIKLCGPYAETAKYASTATGERKRVHKVVFSSSRVPLGVAMKLPAGYEAIVDVRSSTYKKYAVILSNSQGVIDNSYCGNKDEWKAEFIAFHDTVITKGERICQFRIQLSQKATAWQKIKWLFTSGVELEFVDNLSDTDRGGFGSTGVK